MAFKSEVDIQGYLDTLNNLDRPINQFDKLARDRLLFMLSYKKDRVYDRNTLDEK